MFEIETYLEIEKIKIKLVLYANYGEIYGELLKKFKLSESLSHLNCRTHQETIASLTLKIFFQLKVFPIPLKKAFPTCF